MTSNENFSILFPTSNDIFHFLVARCFHSVAPCSEKNYCNSSQKRLYQNMTCKKEEYL